MKAKLIRILRYPVILFLLLVITAVTQIGGPFYLLGLSLQKSLGRLKSWALALILYVLAVFTLIPLLASFNGRHALPLSGNVAPLNIMTCLLNRHYVRKSAYQGLVKTGEALAARYPGTSIRYLDANFPLFNGFPLLPHLSHSDGKKVDIAFQYDEDENPSTATPSWIGYGHYEGPTKGEVDYNDICTSKGHFLYGLLGKLPMGDGEDYQFRADRTTFLVRSLHRLPQTQKIFIEPHLKRRWRLSGLEKVRFHGCHAVRHDDHIHWQVR